MWGNGLFWVLEPDTELAEKKMLKLPKISRIMSCGGNGVEQAVKALQNLASKIEEEHFNLFGGVNKSIRTREGLFL